MNTLRKLSDRVALHEVYPDVVERQQAWRVLIINLVWIVISIAVAPVLLWWATDGSFDAGTVFFPFSLAVAFFNHRLIRQGRLSRARLLFVLNTLVLCVLLIFPNYRIDTVFILVLTLPLTASGVLLPRSGLLGMGAILIVIVAVGGLVQLDTDMQPTPLGSPLESIRTTIIIVAAIVVLDAAMLWTFVNSMDSTQRQRQYWVGLIDTTHQISQTLVELPGDPEVLNRTVEQLRDALGLYHAQVFLADPASGLPVLRASTGFIGRRLLEEESLQKLDEDSPVNDTMRQKDPILLRENSPESQRSGFLPATRSQLLLPLRVGNLLPLGVLDLHSTMPATFSANVTDVLVTVSNHLAAALYGAQQTHQLRASYQERDQLVDRIRDDQQELARMNRQLVGATWGTYLEARRDALPDLEWRDGATLPPLVESELVDQTLRDGQPRLEHRDAVDVLCVPIQLRGQTLGVVEFRRENTERWSPAALELAQAVAQRLALSLENARLFEQAQTTAQREQLVSQITSRLQTMNDLEALLNLAAAQFHEALGATQTRVRLGFLEEGQK
ncbi:MAG: GAF domain-containing protein [Anaerolineae bacterium]|nr:GAF domain-containing protein [Anaerolineae bacterium]